MRGGSKINSTLECDLAMYLMYKGTCLTLLLDESHLFANALQSFNFRGDCVARSQLPATGEREMTEAKQ